VEDNKILAVERSHLSDLMTNVQKMHNDLERSGENDRRRLESQMQMLENQTYAYYLLVVCSNIDISYRQDLKTQLAQERDSVRHVTLQKDIELKELHARLDRNVSPDGLSLFGSRHLIHRWKIYPKPASLWLEQKQVGCICKSV
jgi:nucleoprotein TPR